MVARITTGKSIRGLLHYNENKVADNEAELILASGFAGEVDRMNFTQKLNRFKFLTMMKPNVKTNAVHISLNFHSSEKLDNETLQQIAGRYMQKIGFSDQPFLAYRHDDAKHLHLHIVSTNITAQRQRIDLHDIGRTLSEPARKELEIAFDLVKAESKQFKLEAAIRPADLEKARKGLLPTKRTISNVLTAVLRDYKFTSLAEFNAILKSFNVVALRGEEHTRMFQNKGLMFSILDARGLPTGVPIKASSFYTKPSLKNLKIKFAANIEKRKSLKTDLKQRIDQVLGRYKSFTKAKFSEELKNQGIAVSYRQNEQGLIFGITYVDHWNKVAMNGSDLGKAYSADAITTKFSRANVLDKSNVQQITRSARRTQHSTEPEQLPTTYLKTPDPTKFLEIVLANTHTENGIGIPKRKKKRRKDQRVEQGQQINL